MKGRGEHDRREEGIPGRGRSETWQRAWGRRRGTARASVRKPQRESVRNEVYATEIPDVIEHLRENVALNKQESRCDTSPLDRHPFKKPWSSHGVDPI